MHPQPHHPSNRGVISRFLIFVISTYSIGRSTAYTMIRDGRLRSIRVGGRRLIPVVDAERLLRPEEAE
jgi:excisionase family DNA binding protein